MKRVVSVLCALFCVFVSVQSADASDFSKITSNAKIISALNALESINENSVISVLNGNNLTQKPIRVMFRDLSLYGQGNCEAVTMRTNSGGLAILINPKHMGSPAEAIASLIAHESVHQAQAGTLEEEVKAWTTEARTWKKFNEQNATLSLENTKLTKRLNYIAGLYSQNGSSSLENIIAHHPVYANLK